MKEKEVELTQLKLDATFKINKYVYAYVYIHIHLYIYTNTSTHNYIYIYIGWYGIIGY
jgi:hypothetical protein